MIFSKNSGEIAAASAGGAIIKVWQHGCAVHGQDRHSDTETPHQTMKEEENFLNSFGVDSLLNYNTYTQLKACAEKILEQKDKIVFVYSTGFFGTVCTYLTQKLVNMGILCVSATGCACEALSRISPISIR